MMFRLMATKLLDSDKVRQREDSTNQKYASQKHPRVDFKTSARLRNRRSTFEQLIVCFESGQRQRPEQILFSFDLLRRL
jgi:hypothetical protein